MKICLIIAALIPVANVRAQSAAHECPTTTFFSFQVDAQARFTGDSTLALHPIRAEPGLPNLVQFVVDSTGAIMLETFKHLKSPDAAWAQKARELAAQWHYAPAMLGGCHVKQLVQTPLGP